jgi:RNA polymerase sigma-70 factor (ECF subfamily)
VNGSQAMQTTPTSLLLRLKDPNNASAWRQFVMLYAPVLTCWCQRLGFQDSDAADLVQETMVLLYEKIPQFTYDRGRSFRQWLRTVFVNKLRESQRRETLRPVDPLLERPAPDPLEAFTENEYCQHLVAQALMLVQREFTPTTWKACWETAVEGRSATDVAAELGISQVAVYSARARVLRRLREYLDGLLI